MRRVLFAAAAVGLITAVSAAGQGPVPDQGRPPGPVAGRPATAYLENDAGQPVRFVLSSARGSLDVPLAPGAVTQFPFADTGQPRVLTVFGLRTGELISAREVALRRDHVYTANGPVVPMTGGPAPAQGAAPAARPRDEGRPYRPGPNRPAPKADPKPADPKAGPTGP